MKIKYPAVIVAAIVHFILGGLWYSPILFGNKFIQLINWTPEHLKEVENQSHAKELVIAFIMSLILVYILAHKSREAAAASFDAFRKDEDWIAARKASDEQAGGSLTLATNGVVSVFMTPTDYSPTR